MPILDPSRRQDFLNISRLQAPPFYREILRRLTLGQSSRSLAQWLVKQPRDGPCCSWTWRYWEKLLVSRGREVAATKAATEAAFPGQQPVEQAK